jgi:tRNA-modifying protein YgfZ
VTGIDLRATAGTATVPWMVLRVSGPEAEAYLQGQLSQDLAALEVGATTWSLLLQPTGKLDAWLRVTRETADAFLLDAPTDDPAPVVARLERFKLRTKADIELLDRRVVAVRGPGSEALARAAAGPDDLVLPAGWPGVEGADLLGPDPATPKGARAAGPADLDALRIEAGVPVLGAELGPETIPAEAGAWVIEASVSFTKGCFTGQELVARIDSRGGNVPRPVRALRLDGDDVPPPGAEVLGPDGGAVGRVTSSAASPALGPVALAVIGRAVEVGTAVTVRWDGHQAGAAVAAPPLR